MNIHIDKLKSTIFNYSLLTNINDNLILLAITEPNKYITNPLKNRLMLKYKDINNDCLEFLGDAVLELVINDLLYNKI
jgi:dsRNA-specific ribonuclease